MYKLVVFDLDGTLCDTLSDLCNAVNFALKSENLPTHPLSAYNKFVGNGINNLIKQVLVDKADDEQLFKKVKAHFDSYYPQHLCDDTVPYDGVEDLLSTLRSLNIKTAVHSNKPHAYVPHILKTLFPNHSFEIAWGKRDDCQRKPSPQALIEMMDLLDVDKSQVLYVGDSDVDVLTAHNAGVSVCGVEWGFRGREELLSAGADYVVSDTKELLNVIKG
ncbi:MAG: HAD-IA family hydrolase [Ruminococcus sp.]|nr:HAD-IA family hydrolase [Ruminococcus sp.]